MAFAVILHVLPFAASQDDEFEWFRCDACSATFFMLNKTLVARHAGRRANLPAYEFVELLEEVCDSTFSKHDFGVKQHEGKKYLFGPGVVDHIPDQGFGQMGMGDYDKRLAAYCRMFTEEVGEEELLRKFTGDGFINKTELCSVECRSAASGSGGDPLASKSKPRPKRRPPPSSPPPTKTVGVSHSKQSKTDTAQKLPLEKTQEGPSESAPAASPADSLEKSIGLLPGLSSMQLRWLGEAVLAELAKRASGGTTSGRTTEEL